MIPKRVSDSNARWSPNRGSPKRIHRSSYWRSIWPSICTTKSLSPLHNSKLLQMLQTASIFLDAPEKKNMPGWNNSFDAFSTSRSASATKRWSENMRWRSPDMKTRKSQDSFANKKRRNIFFRHPVNHVHHSRQNILHVTSLASSKRTTCMVDFPARQRKKYFVVNQKYFITQRTTMWNKLPSRISTIFEGRDSTFRMQKKNSKMNPTPINIGERRKPEPYGKPGYLRVDSVHQGDQDKEKGVYHINLVDEVTQWEIVGCVEGISEHFLVPLLTRLMEQFPFRIIEFHSDNGSEYINYGSQNYSIRFRSDRQNHVQEDLMIKRLSKEKMEASFASGWGTATSQKKIRIADQWFLSSSFESLSQLSSSIRICDDDHDEERERTKNLQSLWDALWTLQKNVGCRFVSSGRRDVWKTRRDRICEKWQWMCYADERN